VKAVPHNSPLKPTHIAASRRLQRAASGAPLLVRGLTRRWADLMMRLPAFTVIALALSITGATRAASEGASSVFATLTATKGVVAWHGLVLGMPLTEVEHTLGYTIYPVGSQRLMRRPSARVVVNGRDLQLFFGESNEGLFLNGVALTRMASEDPTTWSQANLVRSLESEAVGAVPVSSRPANPHDGSPAPQSVYSFPTSPGGELVVHAEEETVILAVHEFFDD